MYLDYRLKRLFPTVSKVRWKDYKKSYLLGFLDGLDQRFKNQTQSSEEFALMVQVPAEVLEEQARQMGNLKNRTVKVQLQEMDVEAFYQGLTHAKTSKLMSEELLKEKDEFN